ncbi:intermembrane phospholipid transport protein YdbH family protein [Hyphococcus sp.]|uniref:intermembrane phospholipid transport protein YdbH family protein n=1 Tax=Hyphococcus sp. TaxID=2038636 RepID=UPI0035C72DC8
MRIARFLAIVLTLLVILTALVWVFRLPLAGWAARTAMASAGLEAPQARVTALTFDGVRLVNVAAGPKAARGFSFDVVEVDYDWRRLWRERAIDAVRAGPGALRVRVGEDGDFSIPGLPSGGGSGGNRSLPFDSVSLSEVAMVVDAPQGGATGRVNATYDIQSGGEASIDLSSDEIVWNNFLFQNVKSAAQLDLAADGAMSLSLTYEGDAETDMIAARRVFFTATGDAGSWRDVVTGGAELLSGAVRVAFSAPEIDLRDEDLLSLTSAAQMQTVFGEKLQNAAFAGIADVAFEGGAFQIRLADEGGPLALTTPEGASLTLTPQGSAPFYARAGGRETSSFQFALVSDGADAKGAADLEREGGFWRVAAPIEIDAFVSSALSLDGSRIDIEAQSNGSEIIADIGLKSGLRKATIGRLTINDAPFNGAFRVTADLNAQRAQVVSKSDCFNIERGRGRLEGQDLDVRLSEITLCNAEGPLAVYTWTGDTACTVSGEIAARDGSVRFGKTVARGRPPVVRFDAAYHPARKHTIIKGGVVNGAMTINDAVEMSGVIGEFDFELDAQGMQADAAVNRLRIAQHQGPENRLLMIAPVMASGEAKLEGAETRFSYALTTPEGYRLGAGEGVHHMKTASGETVLTLENLAFSPVGLQPNRISPALKGIVNAADGSLDGEVRLSWAPSEFISTAELSLDNISFAGPTQAVTRTHGVSGTVQLTDLFPVTTNGFQTINVASVDMDALQLGAGDITFELPGDETLGISNAAFPWFGGELVVSDATAGFSGEALIPLQAHNVDLEQVFEFFDVEGLSGEGILSGDLPLIFEGGRARIENGFIRSQGPGVIRYVGQAAEQASAAGENAKVAFDFLRDLRFSEMEVTINGALDGEIKFGMRFEGVGDVTVRNRNVKDVPVLYRINLAVENIDLIRQANISEVIKSRIQMELSDEE